MMSVWRFFTITFAATAMFALWSAGTARANVLYDNLGASSSGSDSTSTSGPLADSFSTGGLSFLFSDLKLLLLGDNTSAGFTSVRLLSDSSGNPGSLLDTLATIDDSALTSAASVFDISSFAPITLAPNTRYWIQLTAPAHGTTSSNWAVSSDTSGPGVAGEFFSNTNGVFPNSEVPYQMAVRGTPVTTAVPVPMSITLFGTSLVGLVGLIRRRAKVESRL
jgi:hypothetical protein